MIFRRFMIGFSLAAFLATIPACSEGTTSVKPPASASGPNINVKDVKGTMPKTKVD